MDEYDEEEDELRVTYEDTGRVVEDFGRLFESADIDALRDVSLEHAGGGVLAAHKFFLTARSEYFDVALSERWGGRASANGVPIRLRNPDAPGEVFRDVVKFIYTGHINLSEESVYEVYQLAQELMLEDLVQLARDYVTSSLTAANAPYHAVRAMDCGDEELERRLAQYVAKNGQRILENGQFVRCSREELDTILGFEHIGAEEDVVLRAARMWTEFNANFDPELAIVSLAEILAANLIRWLSLSDEGYRILNGYGLVPASVGHIRDLFQAVRADGHRYLVQSSVFRPYLRGATQVVESEHPLRSDRFETSVKLVGFADAVFVEVHSSTELAEHLDLAFTSPKSGLCEARLSSFKYPRSTRAFVVPGNVVRVRMERTGERRPDTPSCWGFRFKCMAVITGRRWRRQNVTELDDKVLVTAPIRDGDSSGVTIAQALQAAQSTLQQSPSPDTPIRDGDSSGVTITEALHVAQSTLQQSPSPDTPIRDGDSSGVAIAQALHIAQSTLQQSPSPGAPPSSN